MAFFQACRKSYEAASARRKNVRLTEKLPFPTKLPILLNKIAKFWLNDFLKIAIFEVFGRCVNFSVELSELHLPVQFYVKSVLEPQKLIFQPCLRL